jgi:head-tail adaptor
MRAGRLDRRVSFYAKTSTRDAFNASVDTYALSFTTWGEVTYGGGDSTISNDEKFFSGTILLRVRYRSTIVETMRVLIDSDYYSINYIERLGRKEGLLLTLSKINE